MHGSDLVGYGYERGDMMEITNERSIEIQEFIKSYSKDKVEKWPLEIHGRKEKLEYYNFPIKLLRYNVNNGRLAMEVGQWKIENGRELDSSLKPDSKIIRELLLKLDESKTDELKEDLLKVGQMEPGVITHDGVVINGNRRMAVMELLHDEVDSSGKWQYFDAILLPAEISQSELWKIEAGLQLSKDKVAQYHPVNELLKIRQGVLSGLKPQEIQAAIYGRSIEEIEESIERLKLIDDFLIFFDKGKPNNYGLIRTFGLHEYFINIQKSILSTAMKSGVGKRELSKRVEMAFALIRAHILAQSDRDVKGISHFAIRELGKIYEVPKAYLAYEAVLNSKSNIKEIKPEIILEGFRSAKEVIDLEAEKNKPKKLIDRAIKALDSIDRDSKYFRKEDLLSDITKLIDLAKELEQELRKK